MNNSFQWNKFWAENGKCFSLNFKFLKKNNIYWHPCLSQAPIAHLVHSLWEISTVVYAKDDINRKTRKKQSLSLQIIQNFKHIDWKSINIDVSNKSHIKMLIFLQIKEENALHKVGWVFLLFAGFVYWFFISLQANVI